jgi:hypothetical protein
MSVLKMAHRVGRANRIEYDLMRPCEFVPRGFCVWHDEGWSSLPETRQAPIPWVSVRVMSRDGILWGL